MFIWTYLAMKNSFWTQRIPDFLNYGTLKGVVPKKREFDKNGKFAIFDTSFYI